MEIIEILREHGACGAEQLAQFQTYARLLLEYNEKVNLTAITDPEQIAVKHFLDSIYLLRLIELPQGATLIDVGTGGGFPGVPLKIMRPDLSLTLLDSLKKRTVFLERLGRELGQVNRVVHARAEDYARDATARDKYDCATSRAVAALPALCEYCLPYVRPGGIFLAMKGYEIEQEVTEAHHAIQLLGGRLGKIEKYELPLYKRSLVVIEKISRTPPEYPRRFVKIAKTPL